MTHEELIADGYKAYEAEGITIYWKPSLCVHATECVRGNNEVFNVMRRPWIDPKAAPPDEIAAIIDRCPQHALRYLRKG